jgi:hypothetical protein
MLIQKQGAFTAMVESMFVDCEQQNAYCNSSYQRQKDPCILLRRFLPMMNTVADSVSFCCQKGF